MAEQTVKLLQVRYEQPDGSWSEDGILSIARRDETPHDWILSHEKARRQHRIIELELPSAAPPAIPPDSEIVAIVDELDAAFGVGDEGKSFDVSMHEYWPQLAAALRERAAK